LLACWRTGSLSSWVATPTTPSLFTNCWSSRRCAGGSLLCCLRHRLETASHRRVLLVCWAATPFPSGRGLVVSRWSLAGQAGCGLRVLPASSSDDWRFPVPSPPPLREGVLGRASAWNPFESLDRRRRQGYGQDPNRTRVLARPPPLTPLSAMAGLIEAILWPSPLRNWPGERVGRLARCRLGS
jgi:hypothetical protein